jgi:hypothetical protein
MRKANDHPVRLQPPPDHPAWAFMPGVALATSPPRSRITKRTHSQAALNPAARSLAPIAFLPFAYCLLAFYLVAWLPCCLLSFLPLASLPRCLRRIPPPRPPNANSSPTAQKKRCKTKPTESSTVCARYENPNHRLQTRNFQTKPLPSFTLHRSPLRACPGPRVRGLAFPLLRSIGLAHLCRYLASSLRRWADRQANPHSIHTRFQRISVAGKSVTTGRARFSGLSP